MKNKAFYTAGFLLITVMIISVISGIPFIEKKEFEPQKKSSGAMESMQWMNEIRSYPGRDIPADKYFKAYEYSKNYLSELNDKGFSDSWTSIGPNNIGGRSISFAVHPVDTGTVFMGAASGGLWKSTTGGLGATAWTQINTGYPSLAVSSIAIDSVNPNVMFIGTGENYGYQYSINNGVNVRVTRGMYGIGILKTTDGGNSWTKSLDWSYNNQRGVWSVIINPKNSNIIYAATSEGVWKSYNAGGTWSQVLNYQMAMDMKINPVDTNTLYVSVGNLTNNVPNANVGIYKSVNGGVNWTKLAGGLPATWTGKASLELYWANPNYIYASIANDLSYVGYYTSTNAGVNWTLKTTSVDIGNQGWYNNAHIVKRDNPNTILVGTLDVVKSTNGGTSFTTNSNWYDWITGATPPGQPEGPASFVHADVHFYATNPKDFNKVYCITDGGLYRSNSFGNANSFFSCNGGYVTTQFYGGFSNSYSDSNWCLGGLQDNRSAFYQGTTAWYKTFQGDGMWCAVNSTNDNICYTEYTWGAISKSVNRGVSWNGISPPGSGSESNYCFAAPYICCKSNPSIIYAGGINIYKSTTGGGNWQGPYGSFGGKILSLVCSNFSTDTLYCATVPGTTAGVFRSFNGGLNWTDITGSLPNRYPTKMNINPNNVKEVYITFGGFGTGHVYKSTDIGATWTNITGNLPDLPHQSIALDPVYPLNIYVGNDLGVYATINGGTNWYEFRTGMPYAVVYDLTVVYPNRKLRATTHGNGIWERKLVQNPVVVGNPTAEIPSDYKLNQNYPNPFNPSTVIGYAISRNGFVSIKVYDISGKEVAALVNEYKNAGVFDIRFAADGMTSGIYFYRLSVNNITVDTKKMNYIK